MEINRFLFFLSILLLSSRMDDKSYLVKMNGNGVHGKTALNAKTLSGTVVNGRGVLGNGVNHVSMNGSLYPAKVKSRRQRWEVKPSEMANNTLNPIRSIVDEMKLTPNRDKPMIALSIGERVSADRQIFSREETSQRREEPVPLDWRQNSG